MKCLSLVVFEIFAKIAFWPLNLGPRSKVMAPNESPYMVSYHNRNEVSISRFFRGICENYILTSWPWAKVKGHVTKRKPIYGLLYVYNRNEVSFSRRFRDIWENSILTSWLGPRSKVMAPSESSYMVYYMTVIKMESLTLVVREIFEKKIRSEYLECKGQLCTQSCASSS